MFVKFKKSLIFVPSKFRKMKQQLINRFIEQLPLWLPIDLEQCFYHGDELKREECD